MEFETININELKPAEYNPRIMPPEEQNKLENNLKTFGLVDPIIIDLTDNNTVIGGHQRLEVLKNINDEQELHLLKMGDIGLVFKELDFKIKDKNDQKALNLSLNKIQGDWDYGKLDDLLMELSEENYNLELTGFDDEEIVFSDFDLDEILTFESEEDEEEPLDSNTELTGDTPNMRYEVVFAFNDKEDANNYLKSINISRGIKDKSVLLKQDIDFTFEQLVEKND